MNKVQKILILVLLITFLVINILLINSFGTQDMVAWIRTVSVTQIYGPIKAFGIYNLNYPPIASLFLWTAGKISHLDYTKVVFLDGYSNIGRLGNLYLPIKFAILFFYEFYIILIFLYLHRIKRLDLWNALLWTTLISANFALMEASMALSYIDIFYAPFLFLSFYFLSTKRIFWSGFFLAVSFSIKIFPILLIPVFLAYFLDMKFKPLKIKIDFKSMFTLFFGMVAVLAPELVFYGFKNICQVLSSSSEHGNFLSFNATNLGLILKHFFYHDNISSPYIKDLMKLSFFIFSSLFIWKLAISKKNMDNFLYAGIGILLGYFTLYTGAHENHLFPALVLATSLIVFNPIRRNVLIYWIISSIVFLNLFLFYGLGSSYGNVIFFLRHLFGLETMKIVLSFIVVIFFVYYLVLICDVKKTLNKLTASIQDPSLLRQLPKFLVVGGVAFILDSGLYYILTRYAFLPYLSARTISVAISLAWSFYLNRIWTFEKKDSSNAKQAIRFLIVMSVTSSLNVALMKVGVGIYHLNDIKVLVLVAFLITGLNFFGHRLWSFKEDVAK